MAGRNSEQAKVAADLPAKDPRGVLGSSSEAHPDHTGDTRRDATPYGIGESDRTARIARTILAERRRRASFFDPTIFGEPAWDILLALYGDERTHGRQTIGQLVRWVPVPQTTALRWITNLERHGLLVRKPHPTDLRTVFIELSERGRALLSDYLSGVAIDQ